MSPFRLGVVGTGWIGAIRASAAAANPLVGELHLADIAPGVGERVAAQTGARSWTDDYRKLLDGSTAVDAVTVSTAPETSHYPIARDCLQAGKHVLLEKPMGLTLGEADDLIELAHAGRLKLMIGYTQRFNPKFAYVKQCFQEGRLGDPVTILISRHLTRVIGSKISSRGELGPAQMEATHDIDLALWWMDAARPVKVYAQSVGRVMKDAYGLPDCTWTMVTMDDGTAFTVGANWNLPPEGPGFSSAMVEVVATNGAVFIDDSHRDLLLSTVESGLVRPLSSMPGESVGHLFQGPMAAETNHFIDCVARDIDPLVTPLQARQVMEVTLAADLSAEQGTPVRLPLPND